MNAPRDAGPQAPLDDVLLTRALERALGHVLQALRRQRIAQGAVWGSLTGAGVTLVASLLARLTPLWAQAELRLALLWLVGAGALLGAVAGLLWPTPQARQLRRGERHLKLAERLSTAWELRTGKISAPPPLVRQQWEDTLHHLRQRDLRAAFPSAPPRSARIVAALLGMLLLPALLLSNPQEVRLAQRQAVRQATQEAAAELTVAREELARAPQLSEEERAAALAALDEALAALQARNASPAERQTALLEAEQALAALRQPEAAAQVQRVAEAAPLSEADIIQPLSAALQRGDLDAAAAYLRGLTDPEGEPLTTGELEALADALAQMAEALAESDPQLAEQLEAAAEGMNSGDLAQASASLQEAAEQLSDVAQENASNTALEAAQAQVQEAQAQVGAAQAGSPSTGSEGASGTGAQGAGESGNGQGGAPGGGESAQGGGQSGQAGSGAGGQGHSEDAGSSDPYGEEQGRLAGSGGEVTLPRRADQGAGTPQEGVPGAARVPYQEVYAEYAAEAEAELERTTYPPTLRSYVREYFSGLDATAP